MHLPPLSPKPVSLKTAWEGFSAALWILANARIKSVHE